MSNIVNQNNLQLWEDIIDLSTAALEWEDDEYDMITTADTVLLFQYKLLQTIWSSCENSIKTLAYIRLQYCLLITCYFI